jgi:transposase InsO family protein
VLHIASFIKAQNDGLDSTRMYTDHQLDIVGDITYYDIIDDQWSYIFTDIYSQRILGLVPSLSMEASFASQCLEQAFAQRMWV